MIILLVEFDDLSVVPQREKCTFVHSGTMSMASYYTHNADSVVTSGSQTCICMQVLRRKVVRNLSLVSYCIGTINSSTFPFRTVLIFRVTSLNVATPSRARVSLTAIVFFLDKLDMSTSLSTSEKDEVPNICPNLPSPSIFHQRQTERLINRLRNMVKTSENVCRLDSFLQEFVIVTPSHMLPSIMLSVLTEILEAVQNDKLGWTARAVETFECLVKYSPTESFTTFNANKESILHALIVLPERFQPKLIAEVMMKAPSVLSCVDSQHHSPLHLLLQQDEVHFGLVLYALMLYPTSARYAI